MQTEMESDSVKIWGGSAKVLQRHKGHQITPIRKFDEVT